MTLVDTHCHLDTAPLGDDPAVVLMRAADCGVCRVVVPAYDLPSWSAVLDLAARFGPGADARPCTDPAGDHHSGAAHPGDDHPLADHPGAAVYPALGLHPWAAAGSPGGQDHRDLYRELVAAIDHAPAPVVAIGEIGLDTKIDDPPLHVQVGVLRAQLALAVELDLPAILHCRGAFDELLAEIARFDGRLRGVLHAWSRGADAARRFVKAGLYLGLGGAVTRPRARRVRRTAQTLPLERFVLETDAPSIGLEGVHPSDTEPQHVADVARALSALRQEPVATIAEVTTQNACRLFGLAPRA